MIYSTSKIEYGPVVQSVSTPACHAGGRRFESVPGRQKKKRDHKISLLFLFETRTDSNHQIQQSGGLLFAGGSTTATPLFHESVPGRQKRREIERSLFFFMYQGTDSNHLNTTVRWPCVSPAARRRRLLYFTNPFRVAKKRREIL